MAAYRQTTLTAFQQVEDNLAALRILEQEAQRTAARRGVALLSLQLFTNRYQGGADSYLPVIIAQTTALSNQRNEIDILRASHGRQRAPREGGRRRLGRRGAAEAVGSNAVGSR